MPHGDSPRPLGCLPTNARRLGDVGSSPDEKIEWRLSLSLRSNGGDVDRPHLLLLRLVGDQDEHPHEGEHHGKRSDHVTDGLAQPRVSASGRPWSC